jgi:hypothetical protein
MVCLIRQSIFSYGLTTLPYTRPPLFFFSCSSFFTQPNKLLVSHASMYIYLYSEPCILTVHHIYINTRRKSIPYLCPISTYHIFQNVIQHFKGFNKRVSIHDHIHTQCTLALISSLSHFMISSWS